MDIANAVVTADHSLKEYGSIRNRECLVVGAAYKCLRSAGDVTEGSADDQHWPSLSDRLLVNIASQLLLHLIRSCIKLSDELDEAYAAVMCFTVYVLSIWVSHSC